MITPGAISLLLDVAKAVADHREIELGVWECNVCRAESYYENDRQHEAGCPLAALDALHPGWQEWVP
jgi:hypothetical protein